jgi:hypothetical protein
VTDDTKIGKTELASPSRRDVVTSAAQVAVTAPTVALLLNAYSKHAFAQIPFYELVDGGGVGRGGDDAPANNENQDVPAHDGIVGHEGSADDSSSTNLDAGNGVGDAISVGSGIFQDDAI